LVAANEDGSHPIGLGALSRCRQGWATINDVRVYSSPGHRDGGWRHIVDLIALGILLIPGFVMYALLDGAMANGWLWGSVAVLVVVADLAWLWQRDSIPLRAEAAEQDGPGGMRTGKPRHRG
jgi:hypothetical protein